MKSLLIPVLLVSTAAVAGPEKIKFPSDYLNPSMKGVIEVK